MALLRSVNLGPANKVSAEALRSPAGRLGLRDIQTVVNSGELVFRDMRNEAELEPLFASLVAEMAGFRCDALVRDAADWAEIMKASPAAERPSQLFATILRRPPDSADMVALATLATVERTAAGPRVTSIDFNGKLARSRLRNTLLGRKARRARRATGTPLQVGVPLGSSKCFSRRMADIDKERTLARQLVLDLRAELDGAD